MVGQPQVEWADGDVDPRHDERRRTVSEQSSRSFLSGVRAHNSHTLYGKPPTFLVIKERVDNCVIYLYKYNLKQHLTYKS